MQPANPHNEFAVTVIKDSQIVGHVPKNYLHIIYFNIQRTLFVILLGGGKAY